MKKKTFFCSLPNLFPLDTVSSREPFGNSLDGWAKRRVIHSPAGLWSLYWANMRLFLQLFYIIFLKDPKENPHTGLEYGKTSPCRRGTWKASATLLPPPDSSSSPFIPFRLLDCAKYMITVPLVCLWTRLQQCPYSQLNIVLRDYVCVKMGRQGQEKWPLPTRQNPRSLYLSALGTCGQSYRPGELQILRKSEVTPAAWKDFSQWNE